MRAGYFHDLHPVGHRAAVHGDDPVSGFHAGLRRGRARYNGPHDALFNIKRHLPADHEDRREEDSAEQYVHGSTSDDDYHPPADRLGGIFQVVGDLLFLPLVLVRGREILLAGHLHVSPQRDGAQAVVGALADYAEKPRAEAERKSQDQDAEPPREDEVAQLVDEYKHAEDYGKPEYIN